MTYNSTEEMGDALGKPALDPGWAPSMPMRFRWPVWVIVISVLVIVHLVLFGYVQNMVDMRRCIGYSPDPLFRFIAFNERWRFVTMTMYGLVAATAVLAMIVQAVLGLEFPFIRLAIASSITSTIRMATLYLIPLCNPFVAAGSPPPLHAFRTVHLFLLQLPFRPFALNDLVFSGHTAIYLLILYANPQWPAVVRAAFAGFILLMMYGLIATRDHYTVDLLLAIPCSFFADRVALNLLDRVRRVRG